MSDFFVSQSSSYSKLGWSDFGPYKKEQEYNSGGTTGIKINIGQDFNYAEEVNNHLSLFAATSHFDQPPSLLQQDWLITVKNKLEGSSLESYFKAIADAFKTIEFLYGENNGAMSVYVGNSPPGKTMRINSNLVAAVSLDKILAEKRGVCRDSSRLAAATLQHFGYKVATIAIPRHVFIAVISKNPKEGDLTGIPIKPKSGPIIYLYPFDASVLDKKTGYSVNEAINWGQKLTIKNGTLCADPIQLIYDNEKKERLLCKAMPSIISPEQKQNKSLRLRLNITTNPKELPPI
ncbi:MAG: hypothetical protein HQ564_07720 [Candidatus Saganbacteria bacterium]|nr:hypothetical protein [Candidatus Saganbacteria bacterium]